MAGVTCPECFGEDVVYTLLVDGPTIPGTMMFGSVWTGGIVRPTRQACWCLECGWRWDRNLSGAPSMKFLRSEPKAPNGAVTTEPETKEEERQS